MLAHADHLVGMHQFQPLVPGVDPEFLQALLHPVAVAHQQQMIVVAEALQRLGDAAEDGLGGMVPAHHIDGDVNPVGHFRLSRSFPSAA